jgi:hypothetical protein
MCVYVCIYVCTYVSIYVCMCVYICCTLSVLLSFLQMPDCWLEVSVHLEGPATGHLDTGFSRFPCCLQANAEMVPNTPSCYYMPLM